MTPTIFGLFYFDLVISRCLGDLGDLGIGAVLRYPDCGVALQLERQRAICTRRHGDDR